MGITTIIQDDEIGEGAAAVERWRAVVRRQPAEFNQQPSDVAGEADSGQPFHLMQLGGLYLTPLGY